MFNEKEITVGQIVSRINSVLEGEFLALTEIENDIIYVKFIDDRKFCITVKALNCI